MLPHWALYWWATSGSDLPQPAAAFESQKILPTSPTHWFLAHLQKPTPIGHWLTWHLLAGPSPAHHWAEFFHFKALWCWALRVFRLSASSCVAKPCSPPLCVSGDFPSSSLLPPDHTSIIVSAGDSFLSLCCYWVRLVTVPSQPISWLFWLYNRLQNFLFVYETLRAPQHTFFLSRKQEVTSNVYQLPFLPPLLSALSRQKEQEVTLNVYHPPFSPPPLSAPSRFFYLILFWFEPESF